MPEFIEIAELAAREAGRILLSLQDRVQVREKGPKDLVTQADIAAQAAIREVVLGHFPDHGFLGEESPEEAENDDSPHRWIVDPLDGTVNYVHGLPSFAVSVALESHGEVVAGVVFDPWLNECYRAAEGQGALLNDTPIAPSRCERLRESLLAASFSANLPRGSVEIARFVEVLHESQSLRRLGSAALNLCYVASGRLDGYWATSVKPWDVAAGVLILREAGGMLTAFDGGTFQLSRPELLCAASPELHSKLLDVLTRANGQAV